MRPDLTIAIVLYNSAATLPYCLRSVRPAVEASWAEVIAVDNASPDLSADVVRTELPGAQLLALNENRGFAAGVNAAMRRASGRYWLLLNPDVHVPASGLETLVAWMDRYPEIGVASPDIEGLDGTSESPGRATPSIAWTLLELSRLHRILPERTRGRLLRGPYWPGGDQLNVGWVPGTAVIVRPEAARAAGQLREDLFMYGEDLEWCWRMRRAGWQIGVCASTTFTHETSSSARRSFGEDERERRIAAGIDAACRLMYGPAHARLLAALTVIAFEAESRAPRRDEDQRDRARAAARTWRALATRR
jgi:GT2 family glycosyltransferase